MDTKLSGFEFDKHVLRMDESIIREKLESKIVKRAYNRLFHNEKLDDLVKSELGQLDFLYDIVQNFFDRMNSQKYCNIEYNISENDYFGYSLKHNIEISGSRTETFNLNGHSDLYKLQDGSKVTVIPVKKGIDMFNLIVFDHPKTKLPNIGTIDVYYNFQTSLSLGEIDKRRYAHNHFTKNPLLTSKEHSSEYTEYYWYGKPGEIRYRHDDRFFKELEKSVLGIMYLRFPLNKNISKELLNIILDKNHARKKFDMLGSISLQENNKFIYQGIIESTGAFPFFLWKDNDNEKETYAPIPELTEIFSN